MKKLALSFLAVSLFSASAFAYDYKIVHQAVGCTKEEDHDKLAHYASQNDVEALKKFLTLKLITRECAGFSIGESVDVIETALFSGMIKIRRRGDIQEFWTNFEYVKSANEPKAVEAPKPVEQAKVQMTPQLKKELESKKCTELNADAEVMVCLNKLYAPKK